MIGPGVTNVLLTIADDVAISVSVGGTVVAVVYAFGLAAEWLQKHPRAEHIIGRSAAAVILALMVVGVVHLTVLALYGKG